MNTNSNLSYEELRKLRDEIVENATKNWDQKYNESKDGNLENGSQVNQCKT